MKPLRLVSVKSAGDPCRRAYRFYSPDTGASVTVSLSDQYVQLAGADVAEGFARNLAEGHFGRAKARQR